jgi:hypothetical protein
MKRSKRRTSASLPRSDRTAFIAVPDRESTLSRGVEKQQYWRTALGLGLLLAWLARHCSQERG